ncbi:hypothetical protein niasHT_031744 [Heterodera trifolii]|uniref:Integrase catalytic domain-containing protein n=1 Tax=Heterodera trifolii TaxID=157864 RepID=A0ABD2IY67_9BILA
MHVDFDPLAVDWSHFAEPPPRMDTMLMSGGGSSMGGGGGGGAAPSYPVFTGLPYQRGAGGIGSMFRSFLRFLVPIGRQAGAAIGRQGLETGSRVLSQMLEGRNVKEAMTEEGRAGLKNLLDKAADNLSRQRSAAAAAATNHGGAGRSGRGGALFDFKRYRKIVSNNDNNNNNNHKRKLASYNQLLAPHCQQIQQPQVASTSTGAVVVAGAQRLGEAEQRRKQQALDYTSRHAGTLGIGDGQQVYKFMKGAYRPIKNSSLQAVLAYHFTSAQQPQQHHRLKPPPGYQTFIANAKQHPQLSHLLFPTSSTSSISGEGHGGGGGGGRGGILTKRKSSNAAAVAITATRKARGKKIRGSGASSALLLHTFKKAALGKKRIGSALLFKPQLCVKNANKDSNNSNNKNAEVQAQKRELLIEKVLDELYKDTRSNAAFTSVEPLLLEARRQHPGRGISRAEVRRYLARQRVYTLHRRAVRRFRRLPTLASALKRHNRGHAYLLVCADTLSRQLFVEPVKSKRSSDIVQAFEKIFRRVGYMPWKLMTDQGKEFTAAPVQRFLADKEVQHHCMHTSPQWHAGIAERAIRSIKERLYRYFTHRGAKCWTGVIQHIVTALNGSPNRALFGLRPNDINFGNAEHVRRNQLERLDAGQQQRQSPRARLPFRVGDRVRIEKHKHVFKKGYLPRFTDELFTVAEVRTSRLPITYKLRDDDGELLTGWFYAQDLCLVLTPPPPLRSKRDEPIAAKAGAADSATVGPVYDIERVLRRRRGRDGAEHCFVKWKGYSAAHNSWIPATSII